MLIFLEILMRGLTPGLGHADAVAQIMLLFLKVLLSNEDYKVMA